MASPLVLARPRQLGQGASAPDLAVGVGQRNVAQGVADVSEVSARLFDAEMRMKAAAAAARASLHLESLAADVIATNRYDEYEELYEAEAQRIQGEWGDQSELPPQYRALYDAQTSEKLARLGLRVRAEGRRRQLGATKQFAHDALADLADNEARSPDPLEREVLLQRATELLEDATDIGAFTPEEAATAREAYNAAVWKAAVERGLADNPEALRQRLEDGEGPFAPDRMREPDRQNAIRRATRRGKDTDAAQRAATRFEWAQEDRARRETARAAAQRGFEAARQGALTPELLGELAPDLETTPSTFARLAEIVAKGGRFLPGPPDPGYYAEVTAERAAEPAKFVKRTIDPMLAGNQYEELVRAQGAIEAGQPLAIETTIRTSAARWAAMRKTGWFDLRRDMAPELEGEFYLRVKEAAAVFQERNGRAPNAPELEAEILDPVVLGMVRDFGSGTPAVTGRGEPRPFIPPERREKVEQSLRARGLPVTEANVQAAYEQLLDAGKFE